MNGNESLTGGQILLLFFLIGLYFWPVLTAAGRRHPKLAGVAALNVLLGWTVIGWIIACVWAYSGGEGNLSRALRESREKKERREAAASGSIRCRGCDREVAAVGAFCPHCATPLPARPAA